MARVRYRRGFDVALACRHLRRHDRALGRWIDRLGPVADDPRWRRSFDVVDALTRAILFQQLSGKAAATIVGRVETAAGSRVLDAGALASVDDDGLRGCGVSANKLRSLRDLLDHHAQDRLPNLRQMSWMSDELIIERLTAVRGIGRWTVQMLLMFRLGRADVLPLDDLGIRKGLQILDTLPTPPDAAGLAGRAEAWGPYRTCAGFYLWRIADARGSTATPTPRSQE